MKNKNLVFYFFGIRISAKARWLYKIRQHVFYERYIQYIRNIRDGGCKNKKLLFISHNITLTGAPLTVFSTAKRLHSLGYETLVIGLGEGPLLDMYRKEKMTAIHCARFNAADEDFMHTLRSFDFIFASTLLTYDIVEKIYGLKPCIWRISEGTSLISANLTKYHRALRNAPELYAVSEYTRTLLKPYNTNTKLLIYGVPDKSETYLKYYDRTSKFKRIKICVIGNYSKRKAQDLIIRAYRDLRKDIADKIEIFFIGSNFRGRKSGGHLHFLGEMITGNKYKILAGCDTLFCPSLDDPNPQVVMEAMMLKKPCVISENVGQKDYITDGINGFIIKTGDVGAIKSVMEKLVENPAIIDGMSEKSYALYKKHFNFEDYINRVITVIKEKTI